jgi:DNA repair exonuclease SbcCD nuclease subunit
MNFILCSDWHGTMKNPISRLDEIGEAFFKKLEFLYEQAQSHQACILQAGDMGHRPREWYFLAPFSGFLKKWQGVVKLFTVYGQHDCYLYSEAKQATTMGILRRAGLLNVLGNEPVREGNIALYGCSWGEQVPKVESKTDFNILVTHAPVSDAAIYPGQEFTKAEDFLEKHKQYKVILCGDIHRFFLAEDGERRLVNTGPLLRLTASEYNMQFKPSAYLLEVEDNGKSFQLSRLPIPHKPAEQVLSRNHLEYQRASEEMLESFIQNIDTRWSGHIDIMENLNQFIRQNKIEKEVVNIISEVISNARH